MRLRRTLSLLAPAFVVVACSSTPQQQHTLAELRKMPADTQDVRVEEGLETAMQSYRRFLEETPESAKTAEAMRRLADLKIEKEYGIRGDGDEAKLPEGTNESVAQAGPLEAIKLYDSLLEKYPHYEHNDQVLYQKARAYDELGRTAEAMETIEKLIAPYPNSKYLDEVQFRRAENLFVRRKFRDAEAAYSAVTAMGPRSEYYELSLYKLGWTLYKQEFYDEALHQYIALLDHKVSIGYDFDQKHEEDDDRRTADTFQVISLSFSNLGGPEVVGEYFAANGKRNYEDRVYRNLGEFYRAKLRYNDAAAAYKAFVALYPFHRSSPHFSMRVIEIYEEGNFPKLVLDSKKAFAGQYGLKSPYWHHFDVNQTPEVLAYLKRNLTDLANHYHALYQNPEQSREKHAHYTEALRWYGEFLSSFNKDPEAAPINYQLADLLLENRDFAGAAREYERTAYDYPVHEKAAAAGYAAIYAHRENLKAGPADIETAKRDTVNSSLKFADTFPDHEHAAVVLGAAADDLYAMKDFTRALASAGKLIERYPGAAAPVRRSAWIVVAHSSFDLADYPNAEQAYTRVLEMTPAEDESRAALVENLAASIYKQGEKANELQDYRAAATHFLRIKQVAPTAKIRAAAEYDAGAALIRLQDWTAAVDVLDAFRRTWPEHELQREATQQIASVYRESGQTSQAADEYQRIAAESDDPQVKGEALLLAGELYEKSSRTDRAIEVYGVYVKAFPRPIDVAVETRFKMAGLYKNKGAQADYEQQLQEIVAIDQKAGSERTARTRTLAGRSALVLSEKLYQNFAGLKLLQPFEKSLQEKQRRMDAAMQALGDLVGYEVGEVTAAATFYMAEIQFDFSRALMESERPAGLSAKELGEYDLALEEEAFPFEEKAIEIHEKNAELTNAGIYNAWIDKSLDRLAELAPARYARFGTGNPAGPATPATQTTQTSP